MNNFSVLLILIITVPFLMFITRIFIICWHNFTLSRQIKILEQQQTALQQAQAAYTSTNDSNNTNSNSSGNTGPKESDLPPAYDEVIQSYMLAKQQQCLENTSSDNANGMITNPSSNTISSAISTLTIETDITNSNHASAINVNNPSTSCIMNESTAISSITGDTSSQPPLYEHIGNVIPTTTTTKNDHIV
ncbi:uncharacterized protein ACRADG_010304 isoform 2-T2 [Cochliomyia hominivorax]